MTQTSIHTLFYFIVFYLLYFINFSTASALAVGFVTSATGGNLSGDILKLHSGSVRLLIVELGEG